MTSGTHLSPQMWRTLLPKIAGLPRCPECETVYEDPKAQNSDPVMDECGHAKCSNCFRKTICDFSPCKQCARSTLPKASEKKPLVRLNGFVRLVRYDPARPIVPENIQVKPVKPPPPSPNKCNYCSRGKMKEEPIVLRFPIKTGPSKMGKLVAQIAGVTKCEECKENWDERGSVNSGPVLISCGHIKCRKCYIQTISMCESCEQCKTKAEKIANSNSDTAIVSVVRSEEEPVPGLKKIKEILYTPGMSPNKRIAALREMISNDGKEEKLKSGLNIHGPSTQLPLPLTSTTEVVHKSEERIPKKNPPKLAGTSHEKIINRTEGSSSKNEETDFFKVVSVVSLAEPEKPVRRRRKRQSKTDEKLEAPLKKPKTPLLAITYPETPQPAPAIPNSKSVPQNWLPSGTGKRKSNKPDRFLPDHKPRQSRSRKPESEPIPRKRGRPPKEISESNKAKPKFKELKTEPLPETPPAVIKVEADLGGKLKETIVSKKEVVEGKEGKQLEDNKNRKMNLKDSNNTLHVNALTKTEASIKKFQAVEAFISNVLKADGDIPIGSYYCCSQIFTKTNIEAHLREVHSKQRASGTLRQVSVKRNEPETILGDLEDKTVEPVINGGEPEERNRIQSELKITSIFSSEKYLSPQDSAEKQILKKPKLPFTIARFHCPQCPERFRTVLELKAHGLMHFGNPPKVCHICDMKFLLTKTLQAHIQQAHGGLGRVSGGNKNTAAQNYKTTSPAKTPIKIAPKRNMDQSAPAIPHPIPGIQAGAVSGSPGVDVTRRLGASKMEGKSRIVVHFNQNLSTVSPEHSYSNR